MALRRELHVALKPYFPDLADISDEASFTEGHVGFRLNSALPTFFLSIVANDDADSFRANLAWSNSSQYPSRPFRDLRATIDDFVGQESAELDLACLDEAGGTPWTFYLDEEFGRWKQSLEKAMVASATPGQVVGIPSLQLLSSMPKRCSPAEAIAMASRVSQQIATLLAGLGRQLIERIDRRA